MEIKAIVSDMDGCLVSYNNEPYNSSWDALSNALPNSKEWIEIRDFYVDKKDKYSKWCEKQVEMLKGLSIEEVNKILFPIPYSKGVVPFFNSLNREYVTGLISSGINLVAERIQSELGLDFQISNYLEIKEGVFTGRGDERVGLDDKLNVLSDILRECNIGLNEICFIGDNFNNIPVFEKAGLSVVYNPKTEEIVEKANYIIYDFRELKKILKI